MGSPASFGSGEGKESRCRHQRATSGAGKSGRRAARERAPRRGATDEREHRPATTSRGTPRWWRSVRAPGADRGDRPGGRAATDQTISFTSTAPVGATVGGRPTRRPPPPPRASRCTSPSTPRPAPSARSTAAASSPSPRPAPASSTPTRPATPLQRRAPGPADLRGRDQGNQTISFTSTAPDRRRSAGRPTPRPPPPPRASRWRFTIDATASSVCSISGSGVVSFTAAGTCVIDANQAGDANWNAAPQVQQSFAVGTASPTSQTISFTSTAPARATVGGADLHRDCDRHLGPRGGAHHRCHGELGLLDHRRGRLLHRRRHLRHRREPGRQRDLQRRAPGPAELRGRDREPGQPDDQLHLHGAGLGDGGRADLHADRHRHLGPHGDVHDRRHGELGLLDLGPGSSRSPGPAPASSTRTRPATAPPGQPRPRSSRASRSGPMSSRPRARSRP